MSSSYSSVVYSIGLAYRINLTKMLDEYGLTQQAWKSILHRTEFSKFCLLSLKKCAKRQEYDKCAYLFASTNRSPCYI